ncbi:AAA family ATPase [uncultured Bacteroides sp.]|uniref:AAA family ATPase n=1 Tax=uncultured Bacteroides sp. TaxID=162156 RepID=UPI0026709AD1|nr:AAA family ATPase [uncultured Bacteroides sp.]
MIYIQRVRSNDIGEDYGKQVELGKVFMSHHKWETGEIPVILTFRALSESQMSLNGTKIKTSFKVRGDERGGDRIGVDCKEYANQDRICVLKQFLTEKLHLTPGQDYFILEDVGNDGRSFNLYGVHSTEIPATVLLDKFKGQVVDMDEPQETEIIKNNQPLQQIFYGAPGTGKSHTIEQMCSTYENYRTTFHPDTDYASFVGSYKPITIKTDVRDMAGHIVYENGKAVKESRIVYRYVMQAFLKAYVAAWREQQNDDPKPVFLIVEEINRGNCAQIFGDIFQLLDRNAAGFSDYPIVADDDLAQELKEILGEFSIAKHDAINALYSGGKDVVGMVKTGKCLLLPNNMYIWATMNTSDQSLFPIDSAFKRRWDWNYIKIKDAGENFKIVFSNGNTYDWWKFVSAINERIEGGEIQQEDKKLGYFFAKAKDKVVTPKVLLSKVLFYLYNDVFKDFGLDEDFFKDENGETMSFASYFDHDGQINEDRVERFVTNLGLESESPNNTDFVNELTVNGKKMRYITDAVFEILSEAAKSNTSEAISDAVDEIFADRDDVVKSIDDPESYEKENRWNKTPIIANDGIAFVVSNQWHKNEIQQVQELAEHFNITFDGNVDEYEDEDLSQKGKRLKYSVNGEGNYGIGEAFLKMSKVIAEQPDMTLQKMIEAAKIIRAKAVFLPLSSLSEWKERHVNDSKRDRRFFENDVLTTVGDNVQFIVSTQWGKQRLDKIQEFAATFGMKFEQLP